MARRPTPPPDKDAIRAQAQALGFSSIGFADARAPWAAGERLYAFLAEGRHGSMDWMAETAERRAHPGALWPEARSAIVLGFNYGPDVDPLAALAHPDRAAISCYAQGEDYHDVIKKKLKALGRWLGEASGSALKVFIDTAPLMEKPLAERAGLGWQGKHTNLVSRAHGSWLFLGVILTEAAYAPDPPEEDHCGSCRACVDICPTQAFPAPYQLDARRCLSYLTIEHKGPIPTAFRAAMGNRIYGCDDCLAVCPWNKFASVGGELALQARETLRAPALADLAGLDDPAFRALFAKTAIKRIGRDRFVRNVMIAYANSRAPAPDAVLEPRLADESALVRGAAVWALAQLAPDAFQARRAQALAQETDATVRAEWEAAP
jgi:epoxyqueuosine reductase